MGIKPIKIDPEVPGSSQRGDARCSGCISDTMSEKLLALLGIAKLPLNSVEFVENIGKLQIRVVR